MKSFLENNEKENCTGCTACKSICPKNAISMLEDEEGFYYPKINKEKCVNCGLCKKVCPHNYSAKEIKPIAYSYVTDSSKKLFDASSGGAFGDIIDSFYEENNTVIYGVIFDEKHKVIHIGVDNKKDIDKMKKSKYVQSNMNDVLIKVKDNLDIGKRVIFSGTPCQVAAVKRYLNKDYGKLLCVDIVCHGVPSQKLLDYYINEEEKRCNKKIKKISFREKVIKKNGKYESRNIKITFEDNTSIIKSIKESAYLKGFYSRLFYRPSCYSCHFASVNRESDITIADCREIDKIEVGADSHKGISSVIINTIKGKDVFEKMKGIKKEIPLDFIIENNSSYIKPTKLHKNRNQFFQDLNDSNFCNLVYKYTRQNIIKRGFNFVKRIIRRKKK